MRVPLAIWLLLPVAGAGNIAVAQWYNARRTYRNLVSGDPDVHGIHLAGSRSRAGRLQRWPAWRATAPCRQ